MENQQQIQANTLKWLEEQSQSWVDEDIISPQQRDLIAHRYISGSAAGSSSNWLSGLLVSLGALLIGGGVILLFAHNWEYLGKGARTVLSFLPLVLAQTICFYSYKKKFKSLAWSEAGAVLTFMAIAASIGLIGQTYHIYGDLERFVLTWFALGVPLAYLMRSNAVMVLATGLIVWLCTFQGKPYWLLFITLIPLWSYFFKHQRSGAFYWSTWLASVGFAIAVMLSVVLRESPLSFYPIAFLLLLASAFYGLGKILFGFDSDSFWKNPLTSLGALGIGVFSLILSFDESWAWKSSGMVEINSLVAYLDVLLVFSAIGVISWLCISHWRDFKPYQRLLLAVGVVGIFAILHYAQWFERFGYLVIAMNLFVLVTSTLIIIRAVELRRALLLNSGLLWLSSLIMLRFFESDASILLKGLVFIVIGSGFIGMNIWFNRKHKKSALVQKEAGHD